MSEQPCVAKRIPEGFDVPAFAKTIETAFAELQNGMKLLFECGFYVEHLLFGERLPPLIQQMFSERYGDGHNAPKKQQMKKSEDACSSSGSPGSRRAATKGGTFTTDRSALRCRLK